MTMCEWLPTPVEIGADSWESRACIRTALMVVHTMASCHRLLDVVDCVETDPRIQTVFTVAPDAFRRGVAEHLHDLGALVLPWQQARRERFDLAVAAASGGLADLHAPLLVMAHGAGRGKRVRPAGRGTPTVVDPPVYGSTPPDSPGTAKYSPRHSRCRTRRSATSYAGNVLKPFP